MTVKELCPHCDTVQEYTFDPGDLKKCTMIKNTMFVCVDCPHCTADNYLQFTLIGVLG